MIALDQYEDDDFSQRIYGVITMGEVWRFAILNRQEKTIIKDIHTFRFPEDLEEIFSRIKGILSEETRRSHDQPGFGSKMIEARFLIINQISITFYYTSGSYKSTARPNPVD